MHRSRPETSQRVDSGRPVSNMKPNFLIRRLGLRGCYTNSLWARHDKPAPRWWLRGLTIICLSYPNKQKSQGQAHTHLLLFPLQTQPSDAPQKTKHRLHTCSAANRQIQTQQKMQTGRSLSCLNTVPGKCTWFHTETKPQTSPK